VIIETREGGQESQFAHQAPSPFGEPHAAEVFTGLVALPGEVFAGIVLDFADYDTGGAREEESQLLGVHLTLALHDARVQEEREDQFVFGEERATQSQEQHAEACHCTRASYCNKRGNRSISSTCPAKSGWFPTHRIKRS